MTYSYEFQDEEIVEVNRLENYRAPAAEVLKTIMEKLRGPSSGEKIFERTPILPVNCRMFWREGLSEHYVVEVKPGRFPFRWGSSLDDNEDYVTDGGEVTVSMPWQYFIFSFTREAEPNPYNVEAIFNSLKVCWAFERVQDFRSPVFLALLPNVGGDYAICLGDVYPNSNEPTWKRIEEVVNNFYESHFNGDLGWTVPYHWAYSGEIDSPIYRWERESEKNILCWTDWQDYGNFLPTMRLSAFMNYNPIPRDTHNDYTHIHTLLYSALRESRNNAW